MGRYEDRDREKSWRNRSREKEKRGGNHYEGRQKKEWKEKKERVNEEKDREREGRRREDREVGREKVKQEEYSKWIEMKKSREEEARGITEREVVAKEKEMLDEEVERENRQLDMMNEEDILDVEALENRRIEERRRKRKELEERLGIRNDWKPIENQSQDIVEDQMEAGGSGVEQEEEGLELFEAKEEDLGEDIDYNVEIRALEGGEGPNNELEGNSEKKKYPPGDSYDMFEESGEDSKGENRREAEEVKGKKFDFDDEDQYYKIQPGEVLHDSFKIICAMGKGMYGGVVKAQEVSTGRIVAIKVEKAHPDSKKR